MMICYFFFCGKFTIFETPKAGKLDDEFHHADLIEGVEKKK